MTEFKHTPAPWVMFTEPTLNSIRIQKESDTLPYKNIATVHYNRDTMQGYEQLANAHLIAVAPELLEALESIESFVYELIEEQKKLENRPMTYGQAKILDYCQEAINKARGV